MHDQPTPDYLSWEHEYGTHMQACSDSHNTTILYQGKSPYQSAGKHIATLPSSLSTEDTRKVAPSSKLPVRNMG